MTHDLPSLPRTAWWKQVGNRNTKNKSLGGDMPWTVRQRFSVAWSSRNRIVTVFPFVIVPLFPSPGSVYCSDQLAKSPFHPSPHTIGVGGKFCLEEKKKEKWTHTKSCDKTLLPRWLNRHTVYKRPSHALRIISRVFGVALYTVRQSTSAGLVFFFCEFGSLSR